MPLEQPPTESSKRNVPTLPENIDSVGDSLTGLKLSQILNGGLSLLMIPQVSRGSNKLLALTQFPGQTEKPFVLTVPDRKISDLPEIGKLVQAAKLDPHGFSLVDALLVISRDGHKYQLSDRLSEDQLQSVERSLYLLAEKMGAAVVEKFPALRGADAGAFAKLSTAEKKQVAELLCTEFARVLQAKGKPEYGDTRTLAEVLTSERPGGYCEDLTGAYCSVIEILASLPKVDRLSLPIYPVPAPNHILVCWDDSAKRKISEGQGKPLFFIELTASGRIYDNADSYQAFLDWDPKKSTGYMTTAPKAAALSSELNNLGGALNQKQNLSLSLEYLEFARSLHPHADNCSNYAMMLKKSNRATPEALETAFTKAIELDQTRRKGYVGRAEARIAAAEKEPANTDKQRRLLQAIGDFDIALSTPLTASEKQEELQSALPIYSEFDCELLLKRARCNEQLHLLTNDSKYSERARDDLIEAQKPHRLAQLPDSDTMLRETATILTSRAKFSEQLYDRSTMKNFSDLRSAYKDRSALVGLEDLIAERAERDNSRHSRSVSGHEEKARLALRLAVEGEPTDAKFLEHAIGAADAGLKFAADYDREELSYYKGRALALQSKSAEAIEVFDQILAKDDRYSGTYSASRIERGRMYWAQGKKDEARADWQKVIRQYDQYTPAGSLAALLPSVTKLSYGHFLLGTVDSLQSLAKDKIAAAEFDRLLGN